MEKRKFWLPQLLISLGSLLLGFLGSSVFDYFTNQTLTLERVLIVVLPIVGLMIVILCAVAIQLYVAGYFQLFYQSNKALQKVTNHLGPTIRLLPYGEEKANRESFGELIELINKANEVEVLDHVPWFSGWDSSQKRIWIDQYYDALNRYIQTGKTYIRIIQSDGEPTIIKSDQIKDPMALNHFRMIMAKNSDISSNSKLMGSKVFMPRVSYLLIDQRYLIWEVPIRNLKDKWQLSNDFFIDDPEGKVVGEIRRLFRLIELVSTPITSIQ